MEKWLPIRGYEGLYEISSAGRVRSIERVVPTFGNVQGDSRRLGGRELRPRTRPDGSNAAVSLCKNGQSRKITIIRLMAEHFVVKSRAPTVESNERWLPVSGYVGLYEVSSEGRVRSRDRILSLAESRRSRTVKGRMLKPVAISKGYWSVHLLKNGIRKDFKLHRLVATTFIPNPKNLPEVNHRNFNKANNRIDNLEWCTNANNMRHAAHNRAHGHHGILSWKQVEEIRALARKGYKARELELLFPTSAANIRVVINDISWKRA